jgi:hypothetical protein
MKDLATSLKSPQIKTWTQNDLQLALNNSQTPWDFEKHIRYMSSIFVQNFNSIDDDHKKLSFSKETDFKTETETLNAWISLNIDPNDMKFLSHIYSFMIYMIPKLQIHKSSNKGGMIKKPDLAQSLQRLITLTKHILFFWKFFYNLSKFYSKIFSE